MSDVIPSGARSDSAVRVAKTIPPQATKVLPALLLRAAPVVHSRARDTALDLRLENLGSRACRLSIGDRRGPLRQEHDLMPGEAVDVTITQPDGCYDVRVDGPGGFLRELRGDAASTLAGFDASLAISGPAQAPRMHVLLFNGDGVTRELAVAAGADPRVAYRIPSRTGREVPCLPLDTAAMTAIGYDIVVTATGFSTFYRRFAGAG